MKSRREVFASIYKNNYWGDAHTSGQGSTLAATSITRSVIKKVVTDYKINSIVDVACGNLAWMPLVLDELDGVSYTGCDIVEDLVRQHENTFPHLNFSVLDFVSEPIPKAELIICREAHQHLPIQDIKKSLLNFSKSGANYLLATTHLRRCGIKNHLNIKVGRCRDRNLMLSPFLLPNPLCLFPDTEMNTKDKFLGLWKLPFDLNFQ
jgi:hypothetical protein